MKSGKRSIFRKNLIWVALAILVATIVFVAVAVNISDRLLVESDSQVLLKTANLAAVTLKNQRDASESSLSGFVREVTNATTYRVTIIDLGGKVLAESETNAESMSNHLDRPEVKAAIHAKSGVAVRKSATTGKRTLYVAILVPGLESENDTSGQLVLRLAMALPLGAGALERSQELVVYLIVFIALLSVLVSFILNKQLASPLAELRNKAEHYAKSSGKDRLPALELPEELEPLDATLDAMVEQIHKRADENENLSRLYSSILEAAGEGIIAVDFSLRIIETNPAFCRFFAVRREEILGQNLIELTDAGALPEIFSQCLSEKTEVFSQMSIFRNGERRLKVHASPLFQVSQADEKPGAVAVLSDITELSRLEKIRTDFVANVSHELRTPIQVIQGYTELMQDDDLKPDITKKYLAVVEHNSKRMEQIVNDLLMLSRIENNPSLWLTVERCSAARIVESAINSVQPRAEKKNITVDIKAQTDITFVANSGLVEQALVNLLDNAFQYSPINSQIEIRYVQQGDFVSFSVQDHGPGIPAADQDHIFERFYRVDKSRNRTTGGTGLGLAIVKHIATAHEGSVCVESYVQEGSVFTIRLPVAGPHNALEQKTSKTDRSKDEDAVNPDL